MTREWSRVARCESHAMIADNRLTVLRWFPVSVVSFVVVPHAMTQKGGRMGVGIFTFRPLNRINYRQIPVSLRSQRQKITSDRPRKRLTHRLTSSVLVCCRCCAAWTEWSTAQGVIIWISLLGLHTTHTRLTINPKKV
jgi:hypothetical protein